MSHFVVCIIVMDATLSIRGRRYFLYQCKHEWAQPRPAKPSLTHRQWNKWSCGAKLARFVTQHFYSDSYLIQADIRGCKHLTSASVTIASFFLSDNRNAWGKWCGVQIRRINVKIRTDALGSFRELPCWHFAHILKVLEISLVGYAVTIRAIDILMHFITNFKIILAAVILYHNGLIRCIFTNKTHFR